MDRKQLLAYMTGSMDQELLLCNEYLVAENRILRTQIQGRERFSDGERKTLAKQSTRWGKNVLEEVASIVKPHTMLAWHRKLMSQKFAGSKQRKAFSHSKVEKELQAGHTSGTRKSLLGRRLHSRRPAACRVYHR
jgi:putative transposase